MLRKKTKNEPITEIEWINFDTRLMFSFYNRMYRNLAYKSKLIVRENQSAVFLKDNKIADILGSGMYELSNAVLPVAWVLLNYKPTYKNQINADILFLNISEFTFEKIVLPNPVIIKDKDFGAIKIRAFAKCVISISEPVFFAKYILTISKEPGKTDGSQGTLRSLLTESFQDSLKNCTIPVFDFYFDFKLLSDYVKHSIYERFHEIGIQIKEFFVSNIILSEGAEIALKKAKAGNDSFFIPEDRYTMAENAEADIKSPYTANTIKEELTNTNNGIKKSDKFYVIIGDKKEGPIDKESIIEKIAAGVYNKDTILWQASFTKPYPLGELIDFEKYFQNDNLC